MRLARGALAGRARGMCAEGARETLVGSARRACLCVLWDVRGRRLPGVLVRAEGAREARSWCGSLGARSVCSLPARGALAGRARAAPSRALSRKDGFS